MKLDVTKRETMLKLQGDTVLLNGELVVTIVRVIDVDRQWLELSTRTKKNPECWPLTQELCDQLKPSKDPQAKWVLDV